jgi:hypothetical protein
VTVKLVRADSQGNRLPTVLQRPAGIFFGSLTFLNRYRSNNNWVYLLNSPPRGIPDFRDASQKLASSMISVWPSPDEASERLQQGLAVAVQAPLPYGPARRPYKHARSEPQEVANYSDHLIKEIILLCRQVGKMAVPYLHWFGELFTLFSAGTLTRIMYTLAKHFKLRNPPHQRNVIELDIQPMNPQSLGLLTGLEFNTLCINHNPYNPIGFQWDSLAEWTHKARDYGFQHIYLSVYLSADDDDLAKKHLRGILQSKPDGILFKPTEPIFTGHVKGSTPPTTAYNSCTPPTQNSRLLLDEMQYRAASSCFFVKAERMTPPVTRNLAGLGLGAFSYTQRTAALNVGKLDQYYKITSSGNLPIGECRQIVMPG